MIAARVLCAPCVCAPCVCAPCAPCAPCAACPVCRPCAACPTCPAPAPVTSSDNLSPSPTSKPDQPAGPPTSQISAGYVTLVASILTFLNVWGKGIALLLLNLAAKQWSPVRDFRLKLAKYTEGLSETFKEHKITKLQTELKDMKGQKEKLSKDKKELLTYVDELLISVNELLAENRELKG